MRRTFLGILTFLVLSLSPDSVVFAACPCDYFEDLPLRNVRGRSLVCSEVEKDGMTTRQLSAYRRNDRWSLGADDLGPGDSMQCYTAHTRNNGNACSAPGSLDTSLSHAAGLIEIAACHA